MRNYDMDDADWERYHDYLDDKAEKQRDNRSPRKSTCPECHWQMLDGNCRNPACPNHWEPDDESAE